MVDGMAGDKPAVYIISLLPHQHIVYLYVIRIDCIQPGYVCCSIGKLAPQSDDGHAVVHPTAFYIRVFLGFLVEFVGDMPPISIGTPMGPSGTTCGYCGSLGERSATESSFKKAGLIASQLSCGVRPPYTFVSTGVRYTSRYTRR